MKGLFRSLMVAAAMQAAALALVATPSQARDAASGYEAGTIVVKNSERRLYLLLGNGQTRSYPVALGKAGKTWTGTAYIAGKHVQPAWTPPAEIRQDKPNLPSVIPGGSPQNPMGAAALVLDRGEYAIHGTNAPGSIGRYASYGCIRMHNHDIMDLFARVNVGTKVVVVN